MKKILLLAACAVLVGISAKAENLPAKGSIAQTWNVPIGTNLTLPANDNRQAFGANDKFYVQNKVDGAIYAYDKTGAKVGTIKVGGNWPCITTDQAGNFIVRVGNTWPNSFRTDSAEIKLIKADLSDTVEITLPAELFGTTENGRCDFFGKAQGDVFSEAGGKLFLVTGKSTGVLVLNFVSGAFDADNSYLATVSGATVSASTSTVVNTYTRADGTTHYLYVTRNAAPVDLVMGEDGNFTGTAVSLPFKGACNGAWPFSLGGYDFIAYPTVANYLDGFAITQIGDTVPMIKVEPTVATNGNGIQIDWLNVEPIEGTGVQANLYQYYAASHMTKYLITLDHTATGVENVSKSNVNVVAGVGTINVTGAKNVAIYNMAGALVSKSANAQVPNGVYVVRADSKVAKVLVK